MNIETQFILVEDVKKVYTPSVRRIRQEMGLDLGYTSDKDGNLNPCVKEEEPCEHTK